MVCADIQNAKYLMQLILENHLWQHIAMFHFYHLEIAINQNKFTPHPLNKAQVKLFPLH